ncbi:polymorphic toxin type 15 domain-containing protein [Swingsia samuiensis]|uniref:Novel toxin 15 domain-containing protein n=1 Tax=Swingsia samuiensis TaxID=1293412 RepID=A0A4Y6ULW4_9PROT|nr:polymorphic toxin type 15 domain-containing protein [Swingsia samuiensis]QDH17381.1 hypothetical protein E3D00_07260 [Swingsia samuiensis]
MSGALLGGLAGVEIGGETGALAGPIGAAVGAVLAGIAGLALGSIDPSIFAHVNKKADEDLEHKEPSGPCYDCGDGPDCFKPPSSDPDTLKEFRRQLKGQEKGINEMSPDELLNNIDRYSELGRDAANPGEKKMREDFRNQWWEDYFIEGLNKFDNRNKATEYADEQMKEKAALHNPDMRAGGRPMPTDMGSSRVNSSIGSQWGKKGPSSTFKRWEQLKKAAEKAKKLGKKFMDVDLLECEDS